MAKLFDGECINPACPKAHEKVETWGAGVDKKSKEIIGSECECCRQKLQHVLAPFNIIDRSTSGAGSGRRVGLRIKGKPPLKIGDGIVITESAETVDGKTIKGLAVLELTSIRKEGESN